MDSGATLPTLALQCNPVPATKNSATKIVITITEHTDVPKHIDLPPGDYIVLLAGWRWVMSEKMFTDENVGMIVKASGRNPYGDKPYAWKYGVNRHLGCQPRRHDFPVNYHNVLDFLPALVEAAIAVWKKDQSIVFHCNKGEVRAPVALALSSGETRIVSRWASRAE